MKTKIILSILSVVVFAHAQNSNLTDASKTLLLDTSQFDTMFNTLSKKRVGLSTEQIKGVKNPFLPPKSEVGDVNTPAELPHRLTGIIGNRAKINGEWLEIEDSVGTYKLIKISADSVVISNDTNNIELKLNQGRENVIITYR